MENNELEEIRRRECYRKGEMCEEIKCRFYVDWMETGNCVLRVQREHTLEEIGIALGITRERVRQIADKAMKTFWFKYPGKHKKRFQSHMPNEFRVFRH